MSAHHYLEIVMIAISIGLSSYCFTLARRVKNLNNLESGLGGAIAVMIAEIERLERAVHEARTEALSATHSLAAEIQRAKDERAFWVLQQKFADSTGREAGSMLRKRYRRKEAANEI